MCVFVSVHCHGYTVCFLLDCVGVDGACDGEAVEPLHGCDGGGDRLWRAERVRPHVTWRQVPILL